MLRFYGFPYLFRMGILSSPHLLLLRFPPLFASPSLSHTRVVSSFENYFSCSSVYSLIFILVFNFIVDTRPCHSLRLGSCEPRMWTVTEHIYWNLRSKLHWGNLRGSVMGALLFSDENYMEMLLNDLYSCRNILWNVVKRYQSIFLIFLRVFRSTFLAIASRWRRCDN